MADHAVFRPDAPLGHVPSTPDHLEGLDVQEPVWRKSKHELLDLDGRREVRTQDRSRFERSPEHAEGPPRLRQVEDASVEPVTRSADIVYVAHPKFELVRNLAEHPLDVEHRLGMVLFPELVRDDAPVRPDRTTQ